MQKQLVRAEGLPDAHRMALTGSARFGIDRAAFGSQLLFRPMFLALLP